MKKEPLEIIINETKDKPSFWDKIESFFKVFALIASPLIIAYFGNLIQQQISTNSINKDYVQIAITVLSKPQTKNNENLREWAIQLLKHSSPVEFPEKLEEDFKTGLILLSENDETTIMTKAGKLEIKKDNDYNHKIIVNNQVITTIENTYVSIKYTYDLKESTIVIIISDMGGTGTLPSYFIFEFYKNKLPYISQELSSTGTFIPSINNKNQLIIDLGFDGGIKNIIQYQNSRLEVKEVEVNEKEYVGDEICTNLYDIYTHIEGDEECKGLLDTPMSTMKAIQYYDNDPRLDIRLLEKISEEACREKSFFKYPAFEKKICNGIE